MKQTDGLFHQVFNEIAAEYPSIETDHMIIDIGAAKLADSPEQFDVIVTSNLYGDIISDIAAQVAGSVGLAGSANIGESCAMFEAIHGSAPDIAGKNIANPSGLIQAAVMMLNHIGLNDSATKIQNAWLKTVEEGYHTADIYNESSSRQKMTTSEFGEKVISFLGQKPNQLQEAHFPKSNGIQLPKYVRKSAAKKVLKGVDLFVHWTSGSVDLLADKLKNASINYPVQLQLITNRGIKVWPEGFEETFCTDHWRCRFFIDEANRSNATIIELLHGANAEGIEVIKTENLYEINGKDAFSVGQGQ
jgi:isocitrate dehydrogenase